jgi:hypothetical protein
MSGLIVSLVIDFTTTWSVVIESKVIVDLKNSLRKNIIPQLKTELHDVAIQ